MIDVKSTILPEMAASYIHCSGLVGLRNPNYKSTFFPPLKTMVLKSPFPTEDSEHTHPSLLPHLGYLGGIE